MILHISFCYLDIFACTKDIILAVKPVGSQKYPFVWNLNEYFRIFMIFYFSIEGGLKGPR